MAASVETLEKDVAELDLDDEEEEDLKDEDMPITVLFGEVLAIIKRCQAEDGSLSPCIGAAADRLTHMCSWQEVASSPVLCSEAWSCWTTSPSRHAACHSCLFLEPAARTTR